MKLILYFYILISTHLLNQYFDYPSEVFQTFCSTVTGFEAEDTSEGSPGVFGKQNLQTSKPPLLIEPL